MKNDGGPAFPTGDGDGALGIAPNSNGMSLRAYLASQAMVGLLSNSELVDCMAGANNVAVNAPKVWASISVSVADSLLAELAKEK